MTTPRRLQVSTTLTPRAHAALRELTSLYQTNDVVSAALVYLSELRHEDPKALEGRIKQVRSSKHGHNKHQ